MTTDLVTNSSKLKLFFFSTGGGAQDRRDRGLAAHIQPARPSGGGAEGQEGTRLVLPPCCSCSHPVAIVYRSRGGAEGEPGNRHPSPLAPPTPHPPRPSDQIRVRRATAIVLPSCCHRVATVCLIERKKQVVNDNLQQEISKRHALQVCLFFILFSSCILLWCTECVIDNTNTSTNPL